MTQSATRAETAAALPAIESVRAQARDDCGRPLVVVGFDNGARLRYRETDDGVREEWVGPDDDSPAQVHEREADEGPKALALEAVGAYLSFDGRTRAEFVWGTDNLGVLLGEASAESEETADGDDGQ